MHHPLGRFCPMYTPILPSSYLGDSLFSHTSLPISRGRDYRCIFSTKMHGFIDFAICCMLMLSSHVSWRGLKLFRHGFYLFLALEFACWRCYNSL